MNVEGGSAIPIHITTNAPVGAPALPVYLYTQATLGDRRIDGGPISVYSVSDTELANGIFKLAGNVTAIPVIDYTSLDTAIPDVHPIPVYILNPTPPTPPVVVPWYLAGGVNAANCIAAYRAKGVVDYATSKINLVNPATHPLIVGTIYNPTSNDPSWSFVDGWSFVGVGATVGSSLVTDIKIHDFGITGGTVIIKFTEFDTTKSGYLFGLVYGGGDYSELSLSYYKPGNIFYMTYSFFGYCELSTTTNMVLAISKDKVYIDGLYISSLSSSSGITVTPTPPFAFGCVAENYVITDPIALSQFATIKIQAAAFYNAELTQSQITSITIAMQAL